MLSALIFTRGKERKRIYKHIRWKKRVKLGRVSIKQAVNAMEEEF